MTLNVLCPGGRDPEQHFADGPGTPDSGGHPPVNFHAYAAASGGAFFVDTDNCIAARQAVLVLIRHRLKQTRKAVEAVRSAGLPCLVSWKETGLQQVAAKLDSPQRLAELREIVSLADGVLTPANELLPLYQWAGARSAWFVPTPYPVDVADWDFGLPLAQRHGIFVGTRSFKQGYRHHLHAVMQAATLARQFDCRLTLVSTEGRSGIAMMKAVAGDVKLEIIEPVPYAAFLQMIAGHRIVFQRDGGAVPGQIAGDALLSRTPCVGGNGVVDGLAFPHLSSHGRSADALGAVAESLLTDDDAWRRATGESLRLAQEKLSFAVIARRLREVLASVAHGQ